jgi:hypothetical protein
MTDIREPDAFTPDFEALYEPHLGHGASMTPRMAYCLWTAAEILADTWRCVFDEDLVEALPPIARPYAHGRWLEKFIAGFDHVAERIATGHGESSCLALCTAEEMALHEIIDNAEDFLGDEIPVPEWLEDLPDHGEDDRDFDLMREILFEDHDVLMLFNPELARFINDREFRSTILHPRNWFKPFRT